MAIEWGPNWEDDLAGAPEHAPADPNLRGIEDAVRMEYERVFMMYLPRICEHCLNPSCVASCPSGAMYKREEDGIVLVDQEACRGWRMCVSNCPYKKVYFNWQSGKAEKCTLCYPRIEAGMPTVCSETCVGRIRYIGVVLYDADRVEEAASVADEKDLLDAQLSVFLDPEDPEVRRQAEADGIPADWIDAARRSPVYALAMRHRVALPLHPEYRTLPMVWYVPPLSPVMGMIEGEGSTADPDDVFPAIDRLRIPVRYLSNLLAAGDDEVIRRVLKQLAAMRRYMRELSLGGEADASVAASVGMEVGDMEDMYRLLALAKYDERFVIPIGARRAGRGAVGPAGRLRARLRRRPRRVRRQRPRRPGRGGGRGVPPPPRAGRRPSPSPAPLVAAPRPRPAGRRAAAGPAPAAARGGVVNPFALISLDAAAPRRRAAGGAAPTSPARPTRCPPRRRATPCGPSSPGGRASRRPPAPPLRRDLRLLAAHRPRPHLLHPRRPPPARPGPARRCAAATRSPGWSWRGPSCPTTCR